VDDADLDGDFMGIFFNLRWLQWCNCPRQFSPSNIDLKNLVILDLSNNRYPQRRLGWLESNQGLYEYFYLFFIFFPFVTSFTF
jgi:hypothetical protein